MKSDSPNAGWYRDSSDQERFWDGTAWTDAVRSPTGPDGVGAGADESAPSEAAMQPSNQVRVPVGAHQARRRLLTIGMICVAAAAAGAVLLIRSADEPEAPTVSEPETFTASGTLQLIGSVWLTDGDDEGDGCYGADGYDDLSAGAQVVVRDASGDTVALGELGDGYIPAKFAGLGVGGRGIGCAWDFEVSGVPVGSSAYSVEVAHRGEVSFEQDAASSIGLSLG